jgi:hypothetical protein
MVSATVNVFVPSETVAPAQSVLSLFRQPTTIALPANTAVSNVAAMVVSAFPLHPAVPVSPLSLLWTNAMALVTGGTFKRPPVSVIPVLCAIDGTAKSAARRTKACLIDVT